HFHTDHPVFSCSKIEQKQLNTWVSFQSAEQPLLGQFSVSGNSSGNITEALPSKKCFWLLILSAERPGAFLKLGAGPLVRFVSQVSSSAYLSHSVVI
ncbi:hypothetical protein, partial [Pseudomonas putida]|uniref:hypothetical protein n=1 Tax=Pseudomonas putida TaxID=303 RepID=UPI0035D483FB